MNAPTIGTILLIPFDGSAHAESVLPFAARLAEDRAEVILLQVIPEHHELRGPLGELMLSAEELQAASTAAAEADLSRAAGQLANYLPHAHIDQVIATGEPSEQILAIARQRGVDVMLLSSQGTSATGPGGFGSVVSRIAHSSPVPILVIPPREEATAEARIARILVPHDCSERAELVLPLVEHLSRRLGVAVHVLTVVEDEERMLPPTAIDPHVRDEVYADARNAAQRHIEGIGAHLLRAGLPASWEVRRGPAAPSILDAVATDDMLIITSHGRGGARWPLGSVAEKLVRECSTPVMLLRTPPGPQER